MGSILQSGFIFYDGVKFVIDPLPAVQGPPGPEGPIGPAGPPGSGGIGLGNIIYVGKAGNDTTGDGSFDNPFLTINKANTFLKNKTLGPSGQLWTILVGPGNYAENLSILPNASYLGFDQSAISTFINGNIILDSSWLGFGSTNSTIGNIHLTGAIDTNWVSVSNNSSLTFYSCVIASASFTSEGLGAGFTNILLDNCSVNVLPVLTGSSLLSFGTTFADGLTISDTLSFQAGWFSKGADNIQGILTLNGINHISSATLAAGTSVNSVILNGTHSSYAGDIGNIPNSIAFTNGATGIQYIISGELPVQNIVPANTDGYIITTLGGITTWAPNSGGAGSGNLTNTLYVDLSGNDTTGNGSIFAPFATYNHAASVANSLGAGSGNFFVILFAPGAYSQSISLVPWVNLCGMDLGDGTILNGTIGLDPSFGGGTSFISQISNCQINIVNFNAVAISSSGGSKIEFNNCLFFGSFSTIGTGSNHFSVLTSGSTFTCIPVISDTLFITINTNSYTNGLTLNAPSFGAEWDSYGGSLGGTLTVNGSSGHNNTVVLNGTSVNNLVLNGNLSTYTSTIDGVPGGTIVFSGGALAAQYVINGELPIGNLAPSIHDGYIATTVSGKSVWAPNTGGGGGGSAVGINALFVSSTGSDLTGNGTLALPFATYGHAASTIGSASSINLWSIMFGPGSYSENIQLVPFITLVGFDIYGSTLLNGSIGLASSFTGSAILSSGISSVNISGTTSFNFITTGSTNSIIKISDATLTGTISAQGNGLVNQLRFGHCRLTNTATFSDIQVNQEETGFSSIVVNAPTFGSSLSFHGGSINGNLTLNGNSGNNTTAIFHGTTLSGLLTLNGTLSNYTSTIDGIPGGGLTLSGSAVISQYTILGELPIGNLSPSIFDGYVATTLGGLSVWAPPIGSSVSGLKNTLYVAKNGSDITGTGTIINPYLTIGKANSVVKTMGRTNVDDIFTIVIINGTYNENIAIIPNVSYLGFDVAAASVTILGNITLDSSWSGYGDTASAFGAIGFQDGSTINIDFASTGNDALMLFYDCNILASTFICTGLGTGDPNIQFEFCGVGNATFQATATLVGSFTTAFSSGLIINATGSLPAAWQSAGADVVIGGLVLNGVSQPCVANVTGGGTIDTVTLNGTNATYTSGIGSVTDNLPILSGGALISQYIILGELPPQNILPSNTDGYVLTTSSGISIWAPNTGGGGGSGITQLTGDVLAGPGSGSTTASVVRIHGATVPVAGAVNSLLAVTGTNTLGYITTISSGILTGTISATLLPTITLTGDTTGTGSGGTIATTVAKIHGATVPVAGSLTTGNGLYVSGASALTYSALNLAGGSGWITGNLPITNIAPSGSNGFVLTTVAGVVTWAAVPSGSISALTGDVLASGSGSVVAQVVKINGAAVSAAGSLTTGNSLYVSGSSTLTYSALNLAGGSGWITGVLPIANGGTNLSSTGAVNSLLGVISSGVLGYFTTISASILTGTLSTSVLPTITLTGDATGAGSAGTINTIVGKINGATVPAAGSLITGNSLHVSASAALTYSALNLAGGSGWITGNLPVANIAPAGTNGFVLTTIGGATTWAAAVGGGTITALTQDVLASGSGSVPATVVQAQDGAIVFDTHGDMTWAKNGSMELSYTNLTTDTQAGNSLFIAQSAFTGATSFKQGGFLILQSGAPPAASGSPGNIQINIPAAHGGSAEGFTQWQRAGIPIAAISPVPSSPTYGALYFGNIVPTASNFSIGSDGSTQLAINAPIGAPINFEVGSNVIMAMNSSGLQIGDNGTTHFGGGVNVFSIAPGVLPSSTVSIGVALATDTTGLHFYQTTRNFATLGTFGGGGSLWLTQPTPSPTNYAISSDGTNTAINCSTSGNITLRINGITQSFQATLGFFAGPNLLISSGTSSLGGGTGNLLYMAPATTLPTTSISTGLVMGVDANGLHLYQGSLGNIATIGNTSGVGTIWLSQSGALTLPNSTLFGDGINTALNAPSGFIELRINNTAATLLHATANGIQLCSISGGAAQFGSGQGVLNIGECGVSPTTLPSNGTILYTDSDGLHTVASGTSLMDEMLAPVWNGTRNTQKGVILKLAGFITTPSSGATQIPFAVPTVNGDCVSIVMDLVANGLGGGCQHFHYQNAFHNNSGTMQAGIATNFSQATSSIGAISVNTGTANVILIEVASNGAVNVDWTIELTIVYG